MSIRISITLSKNGGDAVTDGWPTNGGLDVGGYAIGGFNVVVGG